jgi:nucleoside-diphosphate-sugar epimerase
MTQANVGLVAGAHGLVGSYVVKQLRDDPEWDVIATGRRPAGPFDDVRYVQLDLTDTEAMRVADLPDNVTHVFFAAYQIVPDRAAEARINVAILETLVRALQDRGAPVRHVTLYHGGKAYGAHIGQFKIPALESDPRLLGPLFYYDQEDLLRSWVQTEGINFTIFRPDHICGVAFGPFVNLIHIIAVYATISRELNQPLRFPGTEAGYHSLVQLTDSGLLARASVWAAKAPSAQNQIFNISNGDLLRWVNTWPKVADFFGMEVGQPFPYDLPAVMQDKAQLWDVIVKKHGLEPVPFGQMATWDSANGILSLERDLISSTIKLRQAGFQDCMDSETCVMSVLSEMRERRLIP